MKHTLAALAISLLIGSAPAAADYYKLGPDSQEQPDAPHGKVTNRAWSSTILPGTVRDY
jgi:hypothetical protein